MQTTTKISGWLLAAAMMMGGCTAPKDEDVVIAMGSDEDPTVVVTGSTDRPDKRPDYAPRVNLCGDGEDGKLTNVDVLDDLMPESLFPTAVMAAANDAMRGQQTEDGQGSMMVEIDGSGMDFNGDGLADLALVESPSRIVLLANRGGCNFEAADILIDIVAFRIGGADFDADGDNDLVVASVENPELIGPMIDCFEAQRTGGDTSVCESLDQPRMIVRAFANDGAGNFVEVTSQWGLDEPILLGGVEYSDSITWFNFPDLNGDGHPDIWFGDDGGTINNLAYVSAGPGSFVLDRDHFYTPAGCKGNGGPMARDFYDEDGDMDFVCMSYNWERPSTAWRQTMPGRFVEMSTPAFRASAMGGDACDFFNDGIPDYVTSDIGRLILARGVGSNFFDATAVSGFETVLDMTGTGHDAITWAGGCRDVDGDGDDDVEFVGGTEHGNDPRPQGMYMWENITTSTDTQLRFSPRHQEWLGDEIGSGADERGLIRADMDGDGVLDYLPLRVRTGLETDSRQRLLIDRRMYPEDVLVIHALSDVGGQAAASQALVVYNDGTNKMTYASSTGGFAGNNLPGRLEITRAYDVDRVVVIWNSGDVPTTTITAEEIQQLVRPVNFAPGAPANLITLRQGQAAP